MILDQPRSQQQRSLTTETVGCNLCGSHDASRLYRESYQLDGESVELKINRCRVCKLVYVSPRLTPMSTKSVYQRDASRTISSNYCWEGDRSGGRFALLLRRLVRLAPPGRLLDVGCGGGHFLAEARRTGRWCVMGLDPVEEVAEAARRFTAAPVLATTLEQTDLAPGSFSVVTLLGVLEHLHDPLGTLQRVHRLLAPGGVMAAYVPNFLYLRWKDAGLLAYLRHGRSSRLHPQEHLFQFTPATFGQLVRTAGFEVERVDIGRPFLRGGLPRRWAKRLASWAVAATRCVSGIHLGGIEAICRRS